MPIHIVGLRHLRDNTINVLLPHILVLFYFLLKHSSTVILCGKGNNFAQDMNCIYSPIASETLKCFEEAICSKDHARGSEVLTAWSTQSRTKVPRRGTFSHKLLVFSWLKFLCEALGCSSLRTKLRASSMHLHGLSNKIGSSTRSASSMHRGVRGGFSESVNRYHELF